jgi:hypothetical protein
MQDHHRQSVLHIENGCPFNTRQICRLIYALLMFRLACSSNPACLSETDDQEIQTATLRNIGEQLGTGKLSLSSWKGQLLYGKALLNAALNDMQSPRFEREITALRTVIS